MKIEHKTTLLIFIFIQFSNATSAQKGINIGIAPIGLIGKFAVSGEFEGKKSISFGSTLSYNYANKWTGSKVEVNLRYYFAKKVDQNSSEGIYAILQPGIGSFKTPYYVEEESTISILFPKPIYTTNTVYLANERSMSRGIGLGLGYKRSIKHFFLDFNFRYQSWGVNSKPILNKPYKGKDHVFKPHNNSDFRNVFFIGPGSIFAPTLIFGYRIR